MDKEEVKKALQFRPVMETEFDQLTNVFNKAFKAKRSVESFKKKDLG